eukprot:2475576-Rhodomonas_salina.2
MPAHTQRSSSQNGPPDGSSTRILPAISRSQTAPLSAPASLARFLVAAYARSVLSACRKVASSVSGKCTARASADSTLRSVSTAHRETAKSIAISCIWPTDCTGAAFSRL